MKLSLKNNLKALTRWIIFLFIGLPLQLVTMLLYPLLYIYWRKNIYKEVNHKSYPKHENIPLEIGIKTRNNGLFLDNVDDHNALTMYNYIKADGLKALLDDEGNFLRRRNEDNSSNLSKVSGDCVISWCFASLFHKAHDEDIRRATKNYLKYLGSRSYDEINEGDVSNRCNNFGVNYCPDSEFANSGQPAAGPQFYTNSSLFATAYHLGLGYKILFWAHWLIMGGWYWCFAPVIYSEDNKLWYVRDMTMKALYIHLQVFGPRWWIKKPMQFINHKISTHKNELFDSMFRIMPNNLPLCMDAFFSQKEDATSLNKSNGRVSAYIPLALMKMAVRSRMK